MHPYLVKVYGPRGKTTYNAVAQCWWDCFQQAVKEFGVRSIIFIRPI